MSTATSVTQADTHILHRQLRNGLPLATGGQGAWLVGADGKRYLDGSGGAAVSCLGHAHPDVLAAMHAQIDRLAYAHTSFFSTEVAEQLADHLVDTAPEGMSHVYFVSGGSEAVEAALKMAPCRSRPATSTATAHPARRPRTTAGAWCASSRRRWPVSGRRR